MVLFDSVKKEKLALKKEGAINIYLCGPTVYDDAHLGHARSSICFDLLRRVLLSLGREVCFARNYTDIDDKILKKMRESGESLEKITQIYINHYESDMKNLRVLEPNLKPRATEFIQHMIELILHLEKHGFTYTLDDGIYFDTSKDEAYLSLSKRSFEETKTRLLEQKEKKNESDFVLWKFDEEFYAAPFGKGRPGWHSECVAMIEALFKDGLDIHAGGVDLLFPHHENEAAQCRCAFHKDLATHWLHNGFVNINGEKMSKSLNNSFFVKDALKEFCGEALRFYLMSVHYRAHFNYSLEDLALCKKRLDKFYRLKKRLELKEFEENFKKCERESSLRVLQALQDDLNISKALALFDEFIVNANLRLDESKDKGLREDLREDFKELALILGVGFEDAILYFQQGFDETQKAWIEEQIFKRTEAKKAKNYALADELRHNLAEFGVLLLDTPQGTIWEKA
ncbi:cysteine--tRNA ligase [Campylobacter helveticus]|uniref:Cysteine--tRNA ligase n=1 Tax=Campylobacter helveticus TaxID=28898 RepID=A0ABY3L142_9BACT|nr:cysteine--tRNA ligase [Campylobacter helveticus]MCR2038789.1 cysteine--tRNA ligase [Campylobacter helveticus]MCR2063695.1 cysteine--tRNA ligase [Campylobacter helveticus]TXK56787.1 cysteine--tRNA ligase [Campylobacter helveticus]